MRRWLSVSGLGWGLALGLTGAGCASATVDKELRQLRQQVAEHEEARREQAKRIEELEGRMLALVGEVEQRKGEVAHRESIPPLPVVTLRPGKESGEVAPGGPAASGTGDAGGKSAGERAPEGAVKAASAPVVVEAALPNLGVVKLPPAPESEAARAGGQRAESAKELYRRERSQLGAGQKREAMATLGEMVERYPRDTLADDAQYLLGEFFYARRGYTEAAAAFREVVHRWPQGDKAPDAQVKLADCQFAQGRQAAGREALRAVITRYPRSPAARQARRRLGQHHHRGRAR